MPQITALEPQKKNPKRVNLFVDGKFVVGLDLETVVKEGLEAGNEITDVELKYLIEASGHQKILEKVFNFISYRPRSEKEVYDFLIRKKIDPQESKNIVEELRNKKYLSDEEFAKWWVEQRLTFRPSGRRLISLELRQKGVAEQIIKELMNQNAGGAGSEVKIAEKELAQRLAEKKIKSMQNLSTLAQKQKLSAVLARRGFDWEVVKSVIDEILKKK